MHDKAKYANYTGDKLRMDFYLHTLRPLMCKGVTIFNDFGGTKPMYGGMVKFGRPPKGIN